MPLTNADTRTLFTTVEEIHRPSTFLLDRYFPDIVEFDTESIDFDVVSNGRKLAPYVRPDLPGKFVRTGGHVTKSFKPPYVKPKEVIRANRAMRRRPGEAYTGEMGAGARLEAITLDTLDEQRSGIIRRKEQQAAEALDTGQVVVEGEDYPRTVVDFGRPAGLTQTLAGAARWGQANVNPLSAIKVMSTEIQKQSGLAPIDVILDPLAAEHFASHAEIREILDNRRGGENRMQLGPVAPISGGQYLGTIGTFDFYQYQDFYLEENDDWGQMMPDWTCWITSPYLDGVQAHGAIQDADLGMVKAEYAPKVWNDNDPPVRTAMTQSAPLVIPANVKHSARIRVNDGA